MRLEVIHGTPSRFSDPARFSFAHGGKDRRPFPVPTKISDRTIEVLGAALRAAKLGDTERANGFKRLHDFTRSPYHAATNSPAGLNC